MIVAPLEQSTLWSTFQAHGGTAHCTIRWAAKSLVTNWRDTGEHELRGRIPRNSVAATHLLSTDLMVIRLQRVDGYFDEWLVTEVRPSRRGATLDIVAAPARAFLGTLPAVAEKYPSTIAPRVVWARTMPAVQFWLYELQPVNGAIPTWIAKGTWDDELLSITITCDRTNPLELCLQIAEQLTALTGVRRAVVLRPTSSTTYALDIIRSQSAREVRIEEGRNLREMRVVRRRVNAPTIIAPRGAGGELLSDGWWRVASGSGTNWVLEGWDGVTVAVPFDDCWNTRYLRKVDGTYVQITDCSAPGNLVVSSGTGIAVGDLVQLPFLSDGTPFLLVADPARAVDLHGRRDYTVGARTNYLRNAAFADFPGGTLAHWVPTLVNGASFVQDTNTIAWEYGGASVRWEFDGTTAGAPSVKLVQTFAMPHRLRNRKWYCQVRAYSSGAPAVSMLVRLRVANGSGGLANESAFFEIAGRSGIDDWLVATVAFDESAAGVGAWTGGIEITISQLAMAPSRVGYLDLAIFGEDPEGDDSPFFASEPARLAELTQAELVANRTPERYEVEVIDRARADWARYAHEAFEVGATARLVTPSLNSDVLLPIAELQVQELERTRSRLALADAPPRLTTAG